MGRAIDARQKLGGLIRLNPDPEKITEARRDLAAAKIADFIERTVAAAPPLTDQQRAELAALLQSGGVGMSRSEVHRPKRASRNGEGA